MIYINYDGPGQTKQNKLNYTKTNWPFQHFHISTTIDRSGIFVTKIQIVFISNHWKTECANGWKHYSVWVLYWQHLSFVACWHNMVLDMVGLLKATEPSQRLAHGERETAPWIRFLFLHNPTPTHQTSCINIIGS